MDIRFIVVSLKCLYAFYSVFCIYNTFHKEKILTEKRNVTKLDMNYNYMRKDWKGILESESCAVRVVELQIF